MTIQAGITGPPTTPGGYRLRVWTDRPQPGVPVVRFTDSHTPVPNITIDVIPVAADLQVAPTPRQLFEVRGFPNDVAITIEFGGESCDVMTPPAPNGELRLLVGSCFYLGSDRNKLWTAYSTLRSRERPHLRIHCGDQLYLDAGSLDSDLPHLERTVQRYEEYWLSHSYGQFLRAGASIFTPDDHDYWNDFPYRMFWLTRSWDAQWQEHADAADLAFRAFQGLGNPGNQRWFVLDLGLVSLFLMDTRSKRGTGKRNGRKSLFEPAQRDAITTWSQTLTKPGILVSAMPIFQKPVGKRAFYTTDHNLLAFPDDASAVWQAVEHAPHDMMVVAGDIHQGRLSHWTTTTTNGVTRDRFELATSPLSILTWASGRPKPKRPPRVNVAGVAKQVERTYWGVANLDNFALIYLRPGVQQTVDVTVQLRGTPAAIVPEADYGEHEDGVTVAPPHGPVRCERHLLMR